MSNSNGPLLDVPELTGNIPPVSPSLPSTSTLTPAQAEAVKRTWAQRIYGEGLKKEQANLQKYFDLSIWQILIILGLAISLLAAFVTTYNYAAKTDVLCTPTEEQKKKLNTQFIVVLVMGILALVVGILLSWVFRRGTRSRLITLGVAAAGLFAIVYSLTIKYANASRSVKVGVSWASLAVFVVLGILFGSSPAGAV
jgi:magnesium-transporting ATPase (P-type)